MLSLYTFIMGVACRLTFRQQMSIISINGELPGFIVRLTSFTSKHTSFECQIAVNESEKVVFKPIQTALMPVRTTYFRKWENRNKNPDNEVLTERQVRKPQYLCGFRDFPNRINLPLYTKFTPIGAKNGAETKKSHNFKFHTAPEKLLLLRSFFHFS